ncbi:MAG: hypothetical protein A3B37_02890 [Candidatus Sungbacteria bacterium RIFCSPLOWO2_01_FULL_59_16]|uniref:GIY-YIG domain-containing protein n=1 Tax=Candidatus Sungbacteria bacterium RIFCSPLOWO2_01_FULL_59_16 TaxID=1802280 RepID=A0A1G2L9G4_9BACT|nr:MAG: hypothetical protein A3B37_02890 [Candidatus Sungbacteria bacterium RIFCSPLOWO2_01_FULL_59_16]
MWFTYLLLCKGKSIYTGITNNLKQRLLHHRQGRGGRYTRSHRAVKILYSEQFGTKNEALKRETEIKGWRRGRKLDLISERHYDLR